MISAVLMARINQQIKAARWLGPKLDLVPRTDADYGAWDERAGNANCKRNCYGQYEPKNKRK